MNRNSIDPAGLKVLLAVAREGSINRAASSLNTVQSNVTTKLKAFELAIGGSLFERTRKGVVLTSLGRQLMPFAERVDTALQDAKAVISEHAKESIELRIGAMETTAALRLPSVIERFTKRYPQADLVLRTGTTEQLIDEVLRGEIDAALVNGPIADKRLRSTPAYQEELVVLAHASATSFIDELDRCGRKVIVFRRGCSYRSSFERFLLTSGLRQIRYLEFGTLDGIVSCVAAGLGVTMLPISLLHKRLSHERLSSHSLPSAISVTTTHFVTRADGFETSLLTSFLMETQRDKHLAEVA